MPSKSNQTRRSRKLVPPAKPYDDFPLGYHPSGKFQKKVKVGGEWVIKYFGQWAKRERGQLVPVADGGWHHALEEYEDWKEKQELLQRAAAALKATAERKKYQAEEQRIDKLEAEAIGKLRLVQLCNRFLDIFRLKAESGERSALTYGD
jgi:hypothetical protein